MTGKLHKFAVCGVLMCVCVYAFISEVEWHWTKYIYINIDLYTKDHTAESGDLIYNMQAENIRTWTCRIYVRKFERKKENRPKVRMVTAEVHNRTLRSMWTHRICTLSFILSVSVSFLSWTYMHSQRVRQPIRSNEMNLRNSTMEGNILVCAFFSQHNEHKSLHAVK